MVDAGQTLAPGSRSSNNRCIIAWAWNCIWRSRFDKHGRTRTSPGTSVKKTLNLCRWTMAHTCTCVTLVPGAIVAKVAVALALASVLGWALAAAWTIVMLRKIAVEEAHLRTVFGNRYQTYSERTAKEERQKCFRESTKCIPLTAFCNSGGALRMSVFRMSLDVLRYRLCCQFVTPRSQMALIDINRLWNRIKYGS